MTKVKIWQIVGQSANGIIFSDSAGNLQTLNGGGRNQILVSQQDGTPVWVDNQALIEALEAKTDAANALATAQAYTQAQIAALVDNAPVALDTLNELALKLNGEDSAINALLVQVDGKAEKTEVDTAIALAKQEAIQSANQHTDFNVGNAMAAATNQIAQASADIIATAQMDAQTRADEAQTTAITTAEAYTNQAVGGMKQVITADVDAKTSSARTAAVSEANAFTTDAVAAALTQVGSASDAKATDITQAAASDATAKVNALRDAIPTGFHVEGTSTACFLANTASLDGAVAAGEGLVITQAFGEVTGAAIAANDTSLVPKLLFVNGVAVTDEWTTNVNENGLLTIQLMGNLHQNLFGRGGSNNDSVMLLVEYKRYNSITVVNNTQPVI